MSNGDAAAERVYCAGPLFNQAERDEMSAIARVLCAAGFRVYVPHSDGMEFRPVHQVLVDRGYAPAVAGRFLHAAIFALDIYQLVEECGAMVWNLNGRTPDEGAVSEAAIAWTLGKPLVAYKDDSRSLITGRDNPLLVGLVDFETYDNIHALPDALREALARCAAPPIALAGCPRAVQEAAARGRELWTVMNSQTAQGDNETLADVVAQLFATDVPGLRC